MKQKGFSLIELLVVIAIIATIVAMAIPNFLGARQRASDVKKKQEMAALKTALRLYYNDFNKYPGGTTGMAMNGCGTDGTTSCASICTPGFAAGGTAGCDIVYMKQLPTGFLSKILYYQVSSGDDFCLSVLLDNKSDPDIVTSQNRCSNVCSAKYPSPNTKYWVCAD
jgi:prepilin-type N-terminal cleavage/methylation domain-containing protein